MDMPRMPVGAPELGSRGCSADGPGAHLLQLAGSLQPLLRSSRHHLPVVLGRLLQPRLRRHAAITHHHRCEQPSLPVVQWIPVAAAVLPAGCTPFYVVHNRDCAFKFANDAMASGQCRM